MDQWSIECMGFDYIESISELNKEGLDSILEIGLRVLNTSDMREKVLYTLYACVSSLPLWCNQSDINGIVASVPKEPVRPDLNVLHPSKVMKRGKGGSLTSRIVLIHSLAHIESYAIDLSWDVMLRYADCIDDQKFFYDWLKIAGDEARHYAIWENRLKELGSYYGEYPVHNGLWDSAAITCDSLDARLAIVHMVHEARGLDVTPGTIHKLKNGQDSRSMELLESIYYDEITHVKTAVYWFTYLSELKGMTEEHMIERFQSIVRERFHGLLKGPFNIKARERADFDEKWYKDLVVSRQE